MRRTLLTLVVCLVVALPSWAMAHVQEDDLYLIPFSSGTVDPARDFATTDPDGHGLVLVQWREFGDTSVVQRIAASGATLVQPLAPVSYLVWADAAETRAIRGLDAVRFAGVLPAAARVSPSVDDATSLLRVTLVGAGGVAGLPPASLRPRAFAGVDGAVVTVEGGAAEARALARHDRVYSVADAGPPGGPSLLRDEKGAMITASGEAHPGYGRFLEEIGADGSGVVIANVDGGVDFNHPDLTDRIEACIDYTLASPFLCDARNHDDVIGHGTHTLGIMVGTGASGFGDLDGFTYGQGVAPGATAVVQNALNSALAYDNAFADGWRPPYRQSYERGAIVSGNSWGPSGDPQGYDADTREFDTIPRDIIDDNERDDPQGFVLSVMNGAGGTSTQGSPDEAKNIIRVGGTVNRNPTGNLSIDDLCTCTAHGPALDGRLLPDLVAPGQQVVSTRASQGTLCGIPFVGWSPLAPALETAPSPLHAGCTGTSMASPHVTGGYAVFVDWFREHVADEEAGSTPSPALVKAAFVNGADDLSEHDGRDADGEPLAPIPNNQQGWGRFNLGNVIDAWTPDDDAEEPGVVHVDQSVAFTNTGQTHRVRVEAIDPEQPLKATLVWTDAPGPGLGGEVPAWVNDLDLVVHSQGERWLGNHFAGGWSVPEGEPDRRNNVENVFLRRPGDSSYSVRIEAANIIGQASPNADSATWQDFALVVSNARLASGDD